MLDYFKGWKYITTFYAGLNILAEGCLIVFSGQKLESFFNTKIAAQKMVIGTAN